MSETSINHGTSVNRIHLPVWRTLINLVIAVLLATLAPFFVGLLTIPLWLVFGALAYNAPPGILQNLAEAAVITTTSVLYLGGAATLCAGVEFVIFGIPTAILGWRLGRITWRSSIIAGFLIGCLPALLVLPFDQSFGPNYLFTITGIFTFAGETLAMGVIGAFEGLLFWLVWWVLSRRSMPTTHGGS